MPSPITAGILAPARSSIRAGALSFRLKAEIDLTLVGYLEIIQEAQRFWQAVEDEDEVKAVELLFTLLPAICYDNCPEEATWEVAVDALTSFFEGIIDGSEDDESSASNDDPDFGVLAARLADRFGGGIWHWMAEAPLPVFKAGLRLLSPLAAESNLNAMTVTAMGSGLVDKMHSLRIRHQWERAAEGLLPPDNEPLTKEAFIAKFARVGFQVDGGV